MAQEPSGWVGVLPVPRLALRLSGGHWASSGGLVAGSLASYTLPVGHHPWSECFRLDHVASNSVTLETVGQPW